MVRVLQVEDGRGVVGLGRGDLLHVRVADPVRREAVEQVGFDRVHPRHVPQDDDRGMLHAEPLGFVRDGTPVPIEVGGHGERQRVRVFRGGAEAADDRDAGRRQGPDLVVLAQRGGQPDDGEDVLRDQVLGACVSRARVVLRVAPDVLHLATVDTAGLIDRLHVGAHRVALDRRVDGACDVEEAADRDVAAGNPTSSAPGGGGRAAGARRSWHRRRARVAVRLRGGDSALLHGQCGGGGLRERLDGHHAQHRADHDGRSEQGDGNAFSEATLRHHRQSPLSVYS